MGCDNLLVKCNNGSVQSLSGHYGSRCGGCTYSSSEQWPIPNRYDGNGLWNYACGGLGGVYGFKPAGQSGESAVACRQEGGLTSLWTDINPQIRDSDGWIRWAQFYADSLPSTPSPVIALDNIACRCSAVKGARYYFDLDTGLPSGFPEPKYVLSINGAYLTTYSDNGDVGCIPHSTARTVTTVSEAPFRALGASNNQITSNGNPLPSTALLWPLELWSIVRVPSVPVPATFTAPAMVVQITNYPYMLGNKNPYLQVTQFNNPDNTRSVELSSDPVSYWICEFVGWAGAPGAWENTSDASGAIVRFHSYVMYVAGGIYRDNMTLGFSNGALITSSAASTFRVAGVLIGDPFPASTSAAGNITLCNPQTAVANAASYAPMTAGCRGTNTPTVTNPWGGLFTSCAALCALSASIAGASSSEMPKSGLQCWQPASLVKPDGSRVCLGTENCYWSIYSGYFATPIVTEHTSISYFAQCPEAVLSPDRWWNNSCWTEDQSWGVYHRCMAAAASVRVAVGVTIDPDTGAPYQSIRPLADPSVRCPLAYTTSRVGRVLRNWIQGYSINSDDASFNRSSTLHASNAGMLYATSTPLADISYSTPQGFAWEALSALCFLPIRTTDLFGNLIVSFPCNDVYSPIKVDAAATTLTVCRRLRDTFIGQSGMGQNGPRILLSFSGVETSQSLMYISTLSQAQTLVCQNSFIKFSASCKCINRANVNAPWSTQWATLNDLQQLQNTLTNPVSSWWPACAQRDPGVLNQGFPLVPPDPAYWNTASPDAICSQNIDVNVSANASLTIQSVQQEMNCGVKIPTEETGSTPSDGTTPDFFTQNWGWIVAIVLGLIVVVSVIIAVSKVAPPKKRVINVGTQ